MQDETVSVIVPVFNGEKYLAETLESVLAQTYRAMEVIVVDDGSTDGTSRVAESFRSEVRYVARPHRGAGAARNQGIELTQGTLCAFLDADDLWVPDKLARQTAVIRAQPDVDMVFGQMEQFHSPELSEEVKAGLAGHGEILPGLGPGTALIKRESFLRVGLFDPQWRVGEFIDWHARAVEKGLRNYMLPEVLTKRRIHGANMTLRERPAMGDYVRMLKASLDRRREQL